MTPAPAERSARRRGAAGSLLALCLLAGPLLLLALAAHAQERAAISIEARNYDIPPGPLDRVLNAFADRAGILLATDGELTAGKTSPGLRGAFTDDQALQRLLAGTGLTYQFTGADAVTLAEAGTYEGDGAMTLAPITVSGWRPSTTKGYRAEVISSATKTDELLVDVPASVSVVTEDLIDDQADTTVTEALRNVPGVGTGPNPANVSVQEEVTIRGFESALIRVNGVQRRSTGPLSLANVASIEVLKGPFSVLYGDVSPGGFVNIQTKRPQREAAAEVSVRGSQVAASSLDGTQGRGTVDLTGPLNDDGTLLYRLIAEAEGGSSFIDTVDNERQFVAPSLSFLGLDDRLRVDLDLSYLRNDETFLFGIPARNGEPDARIDRNTFLGASDSEKLTEDYTAELRADFQLTEHTRIDGAVTYHRNDITARALRPFGGGQQVSDDNTIERAFSVRSQRTTDKQVEVNLIHDLRIGETDWRLLAGGDVRQTELEPRPGSINLNPFDTISVLEPDNGVTLPADNDPAATRFEFVEENDSWGVYGQAEVWWRERLKLLAGVRYSEVETDRVIEAFDLEAEENPDSVDPRFGALYKLTPATSLYASYTTSFEAASNFDPNNSDPLEAEQYEAGVKHEIPGGAAMITAAVFDLTQENLVTPDPDNPDLDRQIGEAETQGFELELRGALTERLQVQAGYTFLDNEISEDNDGNEGNRLPNVPEHAASVWASYRLPMAGNGSWTVNGGVFYEGARFTGTGNTVEMDDYITTDVGLRYRLPLGERSFSVQLGVKNVFDEEYFAGGFGEGVAFRGDPRTAFARVTARF